MYPGAMYWWKRAHFGGCGDEVAYGPDGMGPSAGHAGHRWAHGGGDWGDGIGGGAFGVRRPLRFLAHKLDLWVVALGVETESELHSVGAMGCDEVQGFLLGRPGPAGTFPAVLRAMSET